MDSDCEQFLNEMEAEKQATIKRECNQGIHNWHHYYSHASCANCGQSRDIQTPIRNDT